MSISVKIRIIKYFQKQDCKIHQIYLRKINKLIRFIETSKSNLQLIFKLKEA